MSSELPRSNQQVTGTPETLPEKPVVYSNALELKNYTPDFPQLIRPFTVALVLVAIAILSLFGGLLYITRIAEAANEGISPNKMPVPLQAQISDTAGTVITETQVYQGDLSVFEGDAVISGTVTGSLTVLQGNALISGLVKGNVSVANGNVYLLPGSSVGGNVVSLTGKVAYADLSKLKVGGHIVGIHTANMTSKSSLHQRPDPVEQFLTNLLQALSLSFVLLGVTLGSSVVLPRQLRTLSQTLSIVPAQSLGAGLFATFVIPFGTAAICLLLTFTIIGIVLIPFFLVLLLVTAIYGLSGLAVWTGTLVAEIGHWHQPTLWRRAVVGSLILSLLTFFPLFFIPIIGPVTTYIIISIGIGSVFISFYGIRLPGLHHH